MLASGSSAMALQQRRPSTQIAVLPGRFVARRLCPTFEGSSRAAAGGRRGAALCLACQTPSGTPGHSLPDKVAQRAKQLQAAVSPVDILPAEFGVMCSGVEGKFETAKWSIHCGCGACGGRQAFSPSAWEKHVGCKYKKWHTSIYFQPGAGLEGPPGSKRLNFHSFFKQHGLEPTRSRGICCVPALIPIGGAATKARTRPQAEASDE